MTAVILLCLAALLALAAAVEGGRALRRESEARVVAYRLAEALRLTREYVGADRLPAIEGWSWYDALRRYQRLEPGYTWEPAPHDPPRDDLPTAPGPG